MAKPYALKSASPESMGLPSRAILNYLKEITRIGVNLHGYILVRHGKILSEGYCAPYKRDQIHRMYSTSKSFASFAIGLLIDDGVISLDDKIAKFFPDKLPEKGLHPFQEEMTVRHLLMMSTCYSQTTYGRRDVPYSEPSDWIKTFFECPPQRKPGQAFQYDTSASTTLGALAERLTGMSVPDFLRQRGFADLGFSDEATTVRTENGEFSWMGSGMLCTLRDLALFAQVVLSKGEFAGKRIISEDYITKATSRQIDNSMVERNWGYGFQFWMSRGGFNCSGAGGQMVYYLPKYDAFLATIGETHGQPTGVKTFEDELHRYIVPAFCDEALPEDAQAQKELDDFIAGLHVQPYINSFIPETAKAVSGKTYQMYPRQMHTIGTLNWKTLRVDFTDDGGTLTYTDKEGEKSLPFAYSRFEPIETYPGFAPAEKTEGKPILAYGFFTDVDLTLPCMTSAKWVDENKLDLLCYATGAFIGTLKMQLIFDGDFVTAECRKSAERFWDDLQGFQSGRL